MNAAREVEVAFEVADDARLPGLDAVPGVAAVLSEPTATLTAHYLDTAERDLLRAGITLRHRTGGPDDGWHLKLPSPPSDGARDRVEHRVPATHAEPHRDVAGPVPDELVGLVRARLHGRPLVPLLTVTTERTVHHLLDPDGREVVEVADDLVVAQVPGREPQRWREWEAELRAGDRQQLAALRRRLAKAGRTRERAAGKVARALDDAVPSPRALDPRDATAGEAVRAYVARQVEVLFTLDPGVRAGEGEAVHDVRTATRRLRAALSVGRRVLRTEQVEPLRDTLRTLGHLLGDMRDPSVQLAALRRRWSDDAPGLVVGPVARRVSADRSGARRRALAALRRFLDSAAHDELCAALDRLADEVPTGPHADRPARRVLRRRAAREWRRLARRVHEAEPVAPGPARDAALHAARKQARRARYAAEIARLAVGSPAARSAGRARALQDVLGAQHDAVLRRSDLYRLAAAAHEAGHSAFSYGRWHALEQADADRHERRAAKAARRALAAKHRRWMR